MQGSYFILPKKLQASRNGSTLNPGQLGNDGIHSLTAGLNFYMHSDNVKLMGDYVHTWSDFRDANPAVWRDASSTSCSCACRWFSNSERLKVSGNRRRLGSAYFL